VVNGVLPTGQFFTVAAATFLLSALAVQGGIGRPTQAHSRRRAGRAALLDSLIGGMRTARRRPVLLYGLLANLIGNAVRAIGVLLGMILYLRQTSADPLTDYSLMMTGYGIGNLGSSFVLANTPSVRPALWLVISKLIFGIGVFLLPLEFGRAWLMAATAFAATNGPFENLSLLTLIQTGVPARRGGQLYLLQMCTTYLGFLLAYLAAPGLFSWFGLRPVIMVAGLLTVAYGRLGIALFGGMAADENAAACDRTRRGGPLRCNAPCPADPVGGGVRISSRPRLRQAPFRRRNASGGSILVPGEQTLLNSLCAITRYRAR
jgi:DHA3 family macrolide efflux protein-like MFS transporter